MATTWRTLCAAAPTGHRSTTAEGGWGRVAPRRHRDRGVAGQRDRMDDAHGGRRIGRTRSGSPGWLRGSREPFDAGGRSDEHARARRPRPSGRAAPGRRGSVERRRRRKEISRVLSRAEALGVIYLGRRSPDASCGLPELVRGGPPLALFGLAPGGVCRAAAVAGARGGLLPHRFTLACAPETGAIGGLFSVTLSIASRRPGVTRHHVLRSPDFPRPAEWPDATPCPSATASSRQCNGRRLAVVPSPALKLVGRTARHVLRRRTLAPADGAHLG